MDMLAEDGGGPVERLTQRERNILAHLAQGRSAAEIAQLETLSPGSVKWYIHQVYAKLGAGTRAAALNRARALGLLPGAAGETAALPAEKHNLPRQLSSFIGREAEIAALLGLVQHLPLVTLTGSGGTGKTRLALQVAGRGLPGFADGCWWVGLAPLEDPQLVPLAAAAALGLRELPRDERVAQLCRFIGGKQLLLVLDNCEHLTAATAELAGRLLAACPYLHILATSRELLGLPGERPFRCPPLTMPGPPEQAGLPEAAQTEAVRLFVERAQNAAPDFRLTAGNAAQVAQVCRQLDGIPLAIELAAARVPLLSMEQITQRLENVFHLLTGGGRAALARHQTLKALVDWSYNLLSEAERRLLCRLSVFAGSWTLAGVEAVCAGEMDGQKIAAEDILDLLAGLVNKSLVEVLAGAGPEPRYRMLEMIRQYAHQRLLERGGLEALREQHLDYYLALGLQAEQHLRAPAARAWRDRLEAELDNLRLAFAWAQTGPAARGLRLAAALEWYWHGSMHRSEGVDWLNRLLAVEVPAPADPQAALWGQIARAKALIVSTNTGNTIGQDGRPLAAQAVDILEALGDPLPADLIISYHLSGQKNHFECLELFRKIDARFYMGEMLFYMSHTLRRQGDYAQARIYLEESLQLHRGLGDQDGEAGALWGLGMLDFLEGRTEQAQADFLASRASYLACGSEEMSLLVNRFQAWMALARGDLAQASHHSRLYWEQTSANFISWQMLDALGVLGWVALSAGEVEQAVQFCEKALALAERPDQSFLSNARYVLARVALACGQAAQARSHLRSFMTHNTFNWPPAQLGFQLCGMLALPRQPRRAAVLFGAQAAVAGCLQRVIPAAEWQAYQQALAELRAALSPADLAAA